MPVVVIILQPRLEQAMQRQHVEHVLQVVTVIHHRRGQPLALIIRRIVAQMVGLPVEHVPAPARFEGQVDIPLEHAVELARRQPGPQSGQRFEPGDEPVQRFAPRVRGRQPEFQLGAPRLEPVETHRVAIDMHQRQPQPFEQPGVQQRRPIGVEAAHRQAPFDIAAQRHGVGRVFQPIEIEPFQQAVQEGARPRASREIEQRTDAGPRYRVALAADLDVQRRRQILAGCRRILSAAFAGRVAVPRLLSPVGIAQGPARVGNQRGIGGDPPVVIDLPPKDACRLGLRCERIDSQPVNRRLGRGLDRQPPGLLAFFQPSQQRRAVVFLVAAQQPPQRRLVQAAALATTAADMRHAQSAGVGGAGQGDIEQPYILVETGQIGLALLGVVRRRHHHAAFALRRLQRQQPGLAVRLRRAVRADERQQHDGIFESLGLVHRDHPDQILVTLQTLAERLAVQRLDAFLQRAMPPAQQRLLTVEPLLGVLRQFAEMQQIGQRPLAVGTLGKPLGDTEVPHDGA